MCQRAIFDVDPMASDRQASRAESKRNLKLRQIFWLSVLVVVVVDMWLIKYIIHMQLAVGRP